MDDERNIQLTVVHPPEEDGNEVRIDLSLIFGYLKRFFVLWLAVAVALGSFVLAVSSWRKNVTYIGDAMALITYTFDEAAKGLAPDGTPLDPAKIQSPNVVEEALNTLQVDLRKMDKVRTNLKVEAVMADESYDRMTLYNNMLAKSNSVNMDLIRSLLSTESNATRYIVSFDYLRAGFSRQEGIDLLNAILDSYRQDFEVTYNYNVALGSSLEVVDYTEYDYAETITIFTNTLDDMETYLNDLKDSDTAGFRSSVTGSTFDDLLLRVSTLRDIDLDQAAAYITGNAVTRNGAEREIAHYEWLIQELTRQKAVQDARLASLTDSIAAYEKDPVIYNGEDVAAADQDGTTDYYDQLIADKLSTQNQISRNMRTIRFYQNEIEILKTDRPATQQAKDRADEFLGEVNEKVNLLLTDVKKTADDYYSKAAFSKTVQVLVPAMAESPSLTSGDMKKNMIIAEGVLLVVYFGAAVIQGIRASNRKAEKDLEQPQTAAEN